MRQVIVVLCLLVGMMGAMAARANVPATTGSALAGPASAEKATGAGGAAAAPEKKAELDVVGDNVHLGTAIATIVIFLCLFLVLAKFAWPPIMSGLKKREESIRESIEAAAKAKTAAEQATRDMESRLGEAQRQAAAQLNQAKADALKVADTIRAQAETESAALKDRTLREIEAAKQQAVTEINTHAAELGTAVARKILQRSVTVDDQQRLVDESLSEMAKKN